MFDNINVTFWLIPVGKSGKYVIYYSYPPKYGHDRVWMVFLGNFKHPKQGITSTLEQKSYLI